MHVAYVGVVVVQQLGSGTLANMRGTGQVAESARYVLEPAGGVQSVRTLVKESEKSVFVGRIGVVAGVSRIVVKVIAALEVEAYLPELEERMVVLLVLVQCLKVAERAAR